jgi:methyl-accepting chemotaxis protein
MAKILDKINAVLGEENSLKKQLTIKFLVAGMVPLLLISIVALWLSNSMASQMISRNLEALKANKVVAIEKYSNTIVNQVLSASDDPNLATNLSVLTDAYEQVTTDVLDTDPALAQQEISRMRDALSRYYNNEFLPTYKDANNGDSVDVNVLLNSLSDTAVVLQYAYIETNPAALGSKHEMFSSTLNIDYDDMHDYIHQTFKGYLEKFGYYDIFLIDNNGNVVYSVYKELDYATNLFSGPYANSGLGKAAQSAATLNGTENYVLLDYAQYTPSYEAPASFIASPIYDNSSGSAVRMGTLIYQMPLDAITAVMSENRGLGETGESYLVGQDKRLRSDSIKSPEKYSVNGSFRNKLKVDSESVTLGLAGQTGTIKTTNYHGQDVVSGYIPVNFGSLQWALIAEIEISEAYAAITQLTFITIFVSLLVVIGIVYVALLVSSKIVEPVQQMQAAMARIADTTDFSERVNVEREDEIGHSAKSLNALLESVEMSIKETNQVVSAMAEGDFSQRVDSDFKGDLLTLKEGVNTSAEAIEGAIKEVNVVVDALAKGDFSQKVSLDLKGELALLKIGVNTSSTAIAEAILSISKLMDSMSNGDFKYRSHESLVGEYAALAEQADSAMNAIDSALSEIDAVMGDVASGRLSARVNAELPGQLSDIKTKFNDSLDEISGVFSETEDMLMALSEGKLYKRIENDFPGEFNALKVSANATASKLTEVVFEIQQAAATVHESTDDIAKGNSSLSARTETQASNLEETAASMDQITTTVKHTATNAGHANKIASEALNQAALGGKVVNEAAGAMAEINDASARIADIISVIDAIAFQTNLLALNAAVEAARAGEQGKGFAVVASEVRNLAGRSANAAKEIKHLIEDSVSKVKTGTELVSKSGRTLEDIISQVENVSSIVSEISSAAEEQSLGINEVHKAIESLQMLTQQNTAMVEEAAAASEELGSQAKGLGDLMDFFEASDSKQTEQQRPNHLTLAS